MKALVSSSAPPTRTGGRGQICIWPGGILWIGTALRAGDRHAHHAVQLSFALEGMLRFRPATEALWADYHACLIPPDLPHAFDGTGTTFAIIFVDPETPEGQRLRARATDGAITPLDAAEGRPAAELLSGAWAESRACARLEPAAREVVRRLTGAAPPHVTTDPRVLGAIELIRARLRGRVTLTDVARDLNLSPSRLRHLFVEEVGLPFRTYVLWQRLHRVIQGIGTENLTHAAFAAGFADAAHMTRTFRRMIGVAPSSFELGDQSR
jgi:AraC family transcriptional regulator